jgi:hypothetical protein
MSDYTRLSVLICAATEQILQGYKACGQSATQTVLQAVALYDLVKRALARGAVVRIHEPDGSSSVLAFEEVL